MNCPIVIFWYGPPWSQYKLFAPCNNFLLHVTVLRMYVPYGRQWNGPEYMKCTVCNELTQLEKDKYMHMVHFVNRYITQCANKTMQIALADMGTDIWYLYDPTPGIVYPKMPWWQHSSLVEVPEGLLVTQNAYKIIHYGLPESYFLIEWTTLISKHIVCHLYGRA